MGERYYVLTEQMARKIVRLLEWATGAKDSLDLGNGTRGLVQQPYRDVPEQGMYIEVGTAVANGTNKWQYEWSEVVPDGSGGWSAPTNARTYATTNIYAHNANEANNSGTGIQGNSVDLDTTLLSDNTGVEMQPVQGIPVVWARWRTDTSGNPTLIFEYVNAMDGECA